MAADQNSLLFYQTDENKKVLCNNDEYAMLYDPNNKNKNNKILCMYLNITHETCQRVIFVTRINPTVHLSTRKKEQNRTSLRVLSYIYNLFFVGKY